MIKFLKLTPNRQKRLHKFFSALATFSLLLQIVSGIFYYQPALAGEEETSAQTGENIEEQFSPQVLPQESAEKNQNPEVSPQPTVESAPEPTTEPTSEPTPEVSPTPTPAGEVLSQESQALPVVDSSSVDLEKPVEVPASGQIVSTPTPTPTEKECLAESQEIKETTNDDWNIDLEKGISETREKVKLGVKYLFPQENKVSVTFKCLPKDENLRTTLKIQQIKISDLKLPEGVNPYGEYAYDITTGMTDGTFEYDMTLPKPEDKSVKVSYMEQPNGEVKEIEEGKLNQEGDKVKVEGIDHFTIYFVISGSDLTNLLDPEVLNASEINQLKVSDDNRYETNGHWPLYWDLPYQQNQYLEFQFNPNIPSNAIIHSAKIYFEYQRDPFASGSNQRDARIRAWDGDGFDVEIADYDDLKLSTPNTDETKIIDVPLFLINTPDKVNNFKFRFYMRGVGPWYHTWLKTRHDYVALDVDYTLASDVTLCKTDQNQNPLSGWRLYLLGDKVGNTINVPSDGSIVNAGSYSNDNYVLLASGTYNYGDSRMIADAANSYRYVGLPCAGSADGWVNSEGSSCMKNYLSLNFSTSGGPTAPGWGMYYNPDHKYAKAFSGGDLNLKIWDTCNLSQLEGCYSDNEGSLQLDIYKGYVGDTGQNGCITFKNVPYGEYQLGEILQDGWQEVSGSGTVIINDGQETFAIVNKNISVIPTLTPTPTPTATPTPTPYCGDNHKDANEECDGTDGVTPGENFCTVKCKLVPIYDGAHQCPSGTVKSQRPVWTGLISSTDPDGETLNLTSGKKYLFEVSGDYSYGQGRLADAAYAVSGTSWSTPIRNDIGIWGTNRGVTSLLGNLGNGVGVIEWDDDHNVNTDHIYAKYFSPTNDIEARFLISDWYDGWYSSSNNQGSMGDNSGSLNLNVYECQEYGSISGYKYEDVNGNGYRDDNENNLLSGWTIKLKQGDTEIDSKTTGADGTYSFNNVVPGDYRVCEVLSEGWISTDPTEGNCKDVIVGAGEDAQVNFGNFKLGKIQGRKYEDLNNDGNHNTGEPYLNDWTIRLYKKDGGSWDLIESKSTGHTGTVGQYRFEGLTLGQYKICEVLKDGWKQTAPTGSANRQQPDEAPRCRTTSITQSGQVRYSVSFGNIHFGSISGYKYEDINGNGQEDEGEANHLAGWTIKLKQGDTEIDSTTTGEGGAYSFTNVAPGDYQVCEVNKEGWWVTDPDVGYISGEACKNVTVLPGQQVTGVNFGNFEGAAINGYKFEDKNGNGVKDGEDSYLDGWVIRLYKLDKNNSWFMLGSQPTSNGKYGWSLNGPGTYFVCEVITDHSGWIQTLPNSVNGVENQSGKNDEASYCYQVIPQSGENKSHLDFGNLKLGEVKACKYDDYDGDGAKDDNEPGIAGVSVMLQRQTGEGSWEGLGWVSTKDDGCYSWVEIEPGVYRVLEDLTDSDLAGYKPTDNYTTEGDYRVSSTLTMVSGGVLAVNFLNELQPVVLGISKTNNTSGSIGPGTTVNYTLSVTNSASSSAYGVEVVDVLPYGFSYVSGSGMVKGIATEPSISGQVLTWNVGEMAAGETVEITYQAKTDNGLETGSYTNMAYASGYNRPDGDPDRERSESPIASSVVRIGVATAVSGTISPNTVYATVLGAATAVGGQVLGAATGSPTLLVVLAALLVLAGLALRNKEKMKKLKIARFLKGLGISLVLMIISSQTAGAAVQVSITDLPARINKYDFKVYYTVLDTSESPSYTVSGWMHKEGASWKQFDVAKSEPSGYFQTKSEYFDGEGKYYFKIIGNGVESSIEEVVIDFSSPEAPRDYRKERLSSTEYKLRWKNPPDSDFEKVLVYRSEVRDFTADSSTLVGQRGGSPNQEMDFVDCCLAPDKEYFYAIRALDSAGNASSLVGDGGSTVTVEQIITPTPGGEVLSSAKEKVNLLPKEEKKQGEVLSESTEGEGKTAESAGQESSREENPLSRPIVTRSSLKWLAISCSLVILGLAAYLIFRPKNRS